MDFLSQFSTPAPQPVTSTYRPQMRTTGPTRLSGPSMPGGATRSPYSVGFPMPAPTAYRSAGGTQPYHVPGMQTQDDFGAQLFGGANRRGFFGGGYYEADPRNFMLPQIDTMNQRFNTAANIGLMDQGSSRAQQAALSNSLLASLQPGAPSVAQQQLNRATDAAVGNAFALGASGPRSGLTTKMAADRAAQAQQEAAGQSAMLRAQEIANTQGLLGSALGQQRGQDIDMFRVGAGGQLDTNRAQLEALMRYDTNAQNAFLNQPGGVFQTLGGMGAGIAGALSPFFYSGGEVPGWTRELGTRDSVHNDVVPSLLSKGEVVLPVSVTKAKDSPEKAKQFVKALQKQKRAA